MKLKIVNGEDTLLDRAKNLGLTSATWQEGDFLLANFDRNCFDLARQIWKLAFTTRLVSPRKVAPTTDVFEEARRS
jgi:hypothetical protein